MSRGQGQPARNMNARASVGKAEQDSHNNIDNARGDSNCIDQIVAVIAHMAIMITQANGIPILHVV